MIDETLDIFDEQGALITLQESEVAGLYYVPLPDLKAFFAENNTNITLYNYKDKSARVFEQDDFIPHYAGYYSDIMTKIEAYL